MRCEYSITFSWDEEAAVWIATSDDVYGLILEDESFDALIQRVRLAVPELLAFEKPISHRDTEIAEDTEGNLPMYV